jgi:hypothetical protein
MAERQQSGLSELGELGYSRHNTRTPGCVPLQNCLDAAQGYHKVERKPLIHACRAAAPRPRIRCLRPAKRRSVAQLSDRVSECRFPARWFAGRFSDAQWSVARWLREI